LLTFAAFIQPGEAGHEARRKAWWLLPWLFFVVLVVASAFNPSFTPVEFEGSTLLINTGAPHPHWPSTVNPEQTLRELAFEAGVYLAAFNLLLAARSRQALRWLLVFGAANTVVLAVFGTLQKLSAQGFYFGAATSPNIRFFATFIYNNHWGAFMVLWLATSAGLIFYHAINHRARDLWHSPFALAVIGVLVLATSAPVSASRAATAMAAFVFILVITHALGRIAAHRRSRRRPVWPPVVALLALSAITIGAVGWLAKRPINERYTETRLALDKKKSIVEDRLELYRDTWTLAMQKPAFGWGLQSYGTAFILIRPRPLEAKRQYEASYVEAHSDWLQSVAETGFVGTSLLLLMTFVPFASVPWRMLAHPLIGYPLLGCVIIAFYAWVEFPFANGAVLIAFWTVYFASIRYARLQARAAVNEP
jgi:O-antigen ligase